MPRVIVFGKSKRRTRKVAHIVRAFQEQGNETLWINAAKIQRFKGDRTEKYILNIIDRFNPDIVFIFSQDIPLPVLQRISGGKIKTVLFYVDWRPDIPASLVELGRLVDIFLVSGRGLIDQYRRAGIHNPIFITDACDKYDHWKQRPILPIWVSDIAFIGQARPHESRLELVRRLKEICEVKVYGRNWKDFCITPTLRSVGPRGYRLICGGAKIILGADIVNNVETHWSNRLWLTLGCGGFLLTNYVPGLEEFFVNREHLVWYKSEDDCMELAKEFLAKPDERKRIAEQGYRLVHEHHTFHHFVDRVLSLCGEGQSEEVAEQA
jgi:spore maturation protein CgeB